MIGGSTDPENYQMIHHLAMYNIGAQATVLQEKLVVLCSKILCSFM